MIKLYAKLAVTIVAGILTAKGIEVGGRKAFEKGKEVLDKRIRKVAKEDTED